MIGRIESVAIIIHLYYLDMWREFESRIRNVTCSFSGRVDIFISVPQENPQADAAVRNINISFPQAVVKKVPNKGMDIGPFLLFLKDIKQQGRSYDLVLKLHSKKQEFSSGVRLGNRVRNDFLRRLAGSTADVRHIFGIFENNARTGMVSIRRNTSIGINRVPVDLIKREMGILDGRDGAAVGYFVEVFSAFRWCAPREMIEQSSTCLA